MTTMLSSSERTSDRSSLRTSAIVVLGMLMALLVLSIITRDNAAFADPLDPRNPKHDGAQAVARVLQQHGVDVRIARGQNAFLDEQVDEGTAVVVTNPAALGRSSLARLRDHAAYAGAIVVVGDASLLGDRFGLDARSVPTGRRPADCDAPLVRGLVVRSYGGSGLEAPGCFGSGDSAMLVRRDALWLMTSPRSLANEHVLESDNGALALRLLGQEARLVWYVADSGDNAASDGFSLSSLLPRWLGPGLSLLAMSLLAVVLWRGRRLGPLVTEPLPVVVRAAESTQSRGRIYRRTGDRHHAAAILVGAARRRLTESLQLPRGCSTETLASAVAARTGRDPRTVLDLLGSQLVTKDSQLVELGRRLIDLENEVRGS